MAKSVLEKEPIDTKENSNIDINEVTSNHFCIKTYLPLIFILIGTFAFIGIFSTIFALININNTKIIEGISINGIDVSGLTVEEATQKLNSEFSKKLDATLTLTCGDYKAEIIPSKDFEANYDVPIAVQSAYSIGRSKNFIINNYKILFATLGAEKIHINLQYNTKQLDECISNISVNIPGLVKQPSYYIENENLIIVNGVSGIKLLQDKTKNLIISNIESLTSSNSIELATATAEPNNIDIEQIHNEIFSEPKNAYIIQEPFELNVGSSGVDFGITLDEINNLLQENKSEYIIPLKITPPEIGVENLGNDIFADNLGSFSSEYKVSNRNRTNNVQIASNKINNVILLPGEEFSYNKIVGERTIANGFKEASVYTSSGVVNGLGGGICQVSSTLYNAVLLANLEVVERRNHRYAVSYVPLGQDATVAYGSIDFRFKNNRKFPIKIVSYTNNGKLSVSIMGIKEDTEYKVSISTKRLQTIPYKTQYIQDSSLPAGTQVQSQYGDNGYKYQTYKTVSLNGKIISSELISTDTYTPLTRIVRVGTKN